jgi:hypothetical protein
MDHACLKCTRQHGEEIDGKSRTQPHWAGRHAANGKSWPSRAHGASIVKKVGRYNKIWSLIMSMQYKMAFLPNHIQDRGLHRTVYCVHMHLNGNHIVPFILTAAWLHPLALWHHLAFHFQDLNLITEMTRSENITTISNFQTSPTAYLYTHISN